MTREEARKAAEVMMAYADGKEIEIFNSIKEWKISQCPAFNWGECHYRIKKEPTYRPFKDKEECWAEMQKHQPFGWVKTGGSFRNIIEIYDTRVLIGGNECLIAFKYIFEDYQFVDGTPFGIKEE